MCIRAAGVTNAGDRFACRGDFNVIVIILIYGVVVPLPTDDMGVKIAYLFGVFDGQVAPDDLTGVILRRVCHFLFSKLF
jgi:hypothetical protein